MGGAGGGGGGVALGGAGGGGGGVALGGAGGGGGVLWEERVVVVAEGVLNCQPSYRPMERHATFE